MTTPARERDEVVAKPRPARTWGIRLLVAIVLGTAVGAVVGVMGVRTLEPGSPGTPDSLQLLLDSVANTRASEEQSARDTVVTASVDSTPLQSADTANLHTVPNLADVDEGEARQTLEDLGFDVGTVMFRRSSRKLGVVLSTFPVAGERIAQPATVNLILSDGRGPADSLSGPATP